MTVQQALRPPAYQVLADEIRAQITSGQLRPGERLPTEPQLCARSGLSRSTVREALRLLASQHLIVTTRGVTGGSFVAQPSTEKLSDSLTTGMGLLLSTATVTMAEIVEVRAMIEGPAVALAAARRTDRDLAALSAALFDPATDPVETMLEAQRAFHRALSAATGNPLYELLTRPLYQLSNEWEIGAVAPLSFWQRVDAEHREILRCVNVRDSAGAARAARAHVAFIDETQALLEEAPAGR
ncbi:transcriptional regulator, GntR family [Micromonospora pattaloongensis]|uniref:Transcriptional regulator, GntR family n=1 Tax=Micromonospora pattaloongensis TaxID=405436 RepID=A0A1H3G095_9ACTN|nr:FCD domain-containing protein [Micromonospora pattaloongensis]SDX96467.1 transcriptional regulator, GntR family [Micromonospora pattaloongensis]